MQSASEEATSEIFSVGEQGELERVREGEEVTVGVKDDTESQRSETAWTFVGEDATAARRSPTQGWRLLTSVTGYIGFHFHRFS